MSLCSSDGPGDGGHDLDFGLRAFLRAAPTKEYLAQIKAPVLVLSGEGDKYFPITSSEEWRDLLVAAGVGEGGVCLGGSRNTVTDQSLDAYRM